MKNSQVDWIEHPPQCGKQDQLLVHVYKAEPEWFEEGCSLLESGVLKILPKKTWKFALDRGWINGPWFRCPTQVLAHFKEQKTTHFFSQTFGHFQSLPAFGISAKDLEELGHKTSPPPADSVLPVLSKSLNQ
jgi:hypothetical protein